MQQPRHELAALIERVRELNDWSDTDVVRRATRHMHKLSKSNISRIRNTDVVSLTGSTIKALAAGLEIPETEVARAALLSMGIDMPDLAGLDLETVIKMDTSISAHNRTMLLGLVRQMRHTTDTEEFEHEQGAPTEVTEPRQEEGGSEQLGAGGAARSPGAPIGDDDKVTPLSSRSKGHDTDTPQRHAARTMESKEKQRRRRETAPEDESQDPTDW